jgi:Ca-activated chloride channel homolog
MEGQKIRYGKLTLGISILLLSVLLLSIACSAPAPAGSYKSPSGPATAPSAPGATSPNRAMDSGKGITGAPPPAQGPSQTSNYSGPTSRNETVGLAVGGAKDVNNFRENIKNGYLPLPTDITTEGLYYDYFFDTGQDQACRKLFCPSYSYAVTRDPFSNKTEYYLAVGLNSGLKEQDFERKKLNLAIVLDISGSMASAFDEYYYDSAGRRVNLEWEDRSRPKLEVAKDAIRSIVDQLNSDDRFGIVIFNDRASVFQKPAYAEDIDSDRFDYNLDGIRATGSTNLADGMKLATEMLDRYREADAYEFENRIIYLTDAMPNTGEIGEYSLLNQLKRNAGNRVYTTFIGIGVDFNSELVQYITRTRGGNYYSVHSPRQFRERVEEEFDYMVTPMVFNLQLNLDASGWDIDTVYGSPEADRATGEIMRVNTLFPSKKQDGETKGGLVLLKLKKGIFGSGDIKVRVSYEDRSGKKDSSESVVYLESARPEYFDNNGIRKGVLLARYSTLVRDWIIDERQNAHAGNPWKPRVDMESGICPPPAGLGSWERQSMRLNTSSPYRSLFKDFARYFSSEMRQIGDPDLQQELDIMQKLSGYGDYRD